MDKHEIIFTVKLKVKLDRVLFWMLRAALDKLSAPKKVTDKNVQMERGQEQLDISESLMRDLQESGLEQSREVRTAGC